MNPSLLSRISRSRPSRHAWSRPKFVYNLRTTEPPRIVTWHNPAGAGIKRRELLTIASHWISLSSPSALIRYDLPRKPGIGRAVADQVFADLPAGTPLQLAGDFESGAAVISMR